MRRRECCRGCAWLDMDSDDPAGGYCMRMPPVMRDNSSVYAEYPHVFLMGHVCGEFRPHPHVKKKRNPLPKIK